MTRPFACIAVIFSIYTAAHAQMRPRICWMAPGHGSGITKLARSPNGALLASSSYDGTVKIWRMDDGSLVRTLTALPGAAVPSRSVLFSPDGATVVGAGSGGANLWRVADGEFVRSFLGLETAVDAAFSPDGLTLAVGGTITGLEEATRLFRVSDGALLDTFIADAFNYVFAVAFTPDGQHLITGAGRPFNGIGIGVIRFWRLSDGQEVRTLNDHAGRVNAVTIAPDGLTFASASEDGLVKIRDIADGSPIHTLSGHTDEVAAAAFSPDGQQLVSASADGTLRLWDPAAGRLIRTITGNNGPVAAAVFSSDGQTLLSGGGKVLQGSGGPPSLRVWRPSDGELLDVFSEYENRLQALAVSPGSDLVAAADSAGLVKLWQIADGGFVQSFDTGAWTYVLAFSPDGQRLAAGTSDDVAQVFDLESGAVVQTLGGQSSNVEGLAYSPDGQWIATADWDGPTRIWNAADGGFVRDVPAGARALAFSPDSQFIATGVATAARLYRVDDGSFVRTFSAHAAGIRALAFSPDGSQLATGSADKSIKLHNVANGALLDTLIGHDGWVHTLAYSPNGLMLASGSEGDISLRFWDPINGTPLAVFDRETGTGARPVAFTPDGGLFAYARLDGTLVVALSDITIVPGDVDGDGGADLADVPPFVQVLLDSPITPADVHRADVNEDGRADGLDIGPFVASLIRE